MPANVPPGTNVTVLLQVAPGTNAAVYAVEDKPPAGWAVSGITGGGIYDSKRGKVKWGPFFDTTPRTLSYTVAVPPSTTGVARFSGTAAFDDVQSGITGVRTPFVGAGISTGTFVVRHLPIGYVPGKPMLVSLDVFPLTDVDFVVVEEVMPGGWSVGSVSDGGVLGPPQTVRFGVYLDGQQRRLTYQITPPSPLSGTYEFQGTAFANHSESAVGGDHLIDPSQLHPGDVDPLDGWMTIGELTAYGAAWKRGGEWPLPPQPVQPDYIIRAIELWLGGERYGFDASITNAPFWWVNLTNAVPAGDIPIAIQPGSTTFKGTAVVAMPASFQPGVPFTVTITSTPAASVLNYALEDQPPEGWTVLTDSISYGGSYDALRGKVKWGPFFENFPRTNSYQVSPPLDAGAVGQFVGGAAFDGETAAFIGPRQIVRSGNPPPRFALVRLLPAGLELTLQGGGVGVVKLQSSTDLIVWEPVATNATFGEPVIFVDSSVTNRVRCFYRALWQ
jgi:hypothetical protein